MRSDFRAKEAIVEKIPLNEVSKSNWRLDARHYVLFRKTLDSKISILDSKALGDCCTDVFEVPPFIHLYVDKQNGVPFYTSSALFESDLKPAHFLSKTMRNLAKYKITKGQLLMARSGSGGLISCVTMAGTILDGATASDHVIRFIPNDNEISPGYLCAYLRSSIGQKELLRHASGAAIPAIRPESILSIRVPMIPTGHQSRINELINLSIVEREKAILIINDVKEALLTKNRLPEIVSGNHSEHVETFSVSSNDIFGGDVDYSEYRLDAHHYNPVARLAIENLKKCRSKIETVGKVTANVFMGNRFSRNYVDAEYGKPFLSGKNIIQIRPTDLKYVSTSETRELEELKLKQDWTLITRSGTIGRTCFVWKNYENWCATEDIIRVVPNREIIDAGYLYAFLSSSYGYEQILRFRHGSVIDHITPEQVQHVLIPLPSEKDQKLIGDKVREAYEKRAEAIRLEDEAQAILTSELKSLSGEA